MAEVRMQLTGVTFDDAKGLLYLHLTAPDGNLPLPPGVREDLWQPSSASLRTEGISVKKGLTASPAGTYIDPADNKTYRVTWDATAGRWSAPVLVP